MNRIRAGFGSTLILLGLCASPGTAAAVQTEPGSELRVFLMTMGPGDRIWERFGHNALWIRDEAAGTDVAYNWGVFDFAQENFYRRFAEGRMLYRLEAYDALATIRVYEQANRSVWIQELNLSPAQRVRLRDRVEWNALPENRDYRYDYYRDNCSTRIRDVLDEVLDGRIRAATADRPAGTTYRFHTRRLAAPHLPTFLALDFGIGRLTDRPMSVWDEMFIPMKVQEHLRDITVVHDGEEAPLVLAERTLFVADRAAEAAVPPGREPAFLLAGLLAGGLVAGMGRIGRSRPAARRAFLLAAAGWGLATGLLGVVLAWLWGFTDHWSAYRNENLLLANPLGLLLFASVIAAAAGSAASRAAAPWIVAGLAAIGVVGLGLHLLLGSSQTNGTIIALVLPVHLGLALGMLGARSAGTAPRSDRTAPRSARRRRARGRNS